MQRPHRSRFRLSAAIALGVASFGAIAFAGVSAASGARPHAASTGDLTTYDYSNARFGVDTVDPAIHHVASSATWNDALDGSVFGQPLVYDGYVYVGTENDTVYAISAKTGAVAWHTHVGNAAPLSVVDSAPTLGGGCGDIDPLGITGTPVINTANNQLFVAEETLVGGSTWQDVRHRLVDVSLSTHRELWYRSIDPPDGNQPSHYYIAAEQQRPGLTLLDGRVYVEYGGLNGDCGQYHGYVVSVPDIGIGALTSYQVASQREAGIWGAGGAVVSPKGNLYVTTGNGASNSLAHYDEGNSIIELSPKLKRLGYWAPSNWVALNDGDWDLGSASPIDVPLTSLIFAAGKPAQNDTPGYVLGDKLAGIGKGAYTGSLCPGGGVFGADAADALAKAIYVFAPCGSGTEGVIVHTKAPISWRRAWSASTGSPNGPPIVAGGLVWALNWNGGGLFGMAPTTGTVLFQRSTAGLNHFATPGAGDGMLVVPTRAGVEAFSTS
jgi:outer membrane protein assembly factor BamB